MTDGGPDEARARVPLSCCVVAYNEEKNIRDCLESVSWADEMIVVDSHSTDATVDIAREYTDRIIDRDFEGYVEQKQFAVDQTSNSWVMYMDADERVSPELKDEILEALRDPGDVRGFSMPRLTYYLGRFIRHGGWYPDRKLRLFRKDCGKLVGRNPHESVEVEGPTAALKGDLVHYTYRDIAHHISKMDHFTRIAAKDLADEGRKAHAVDLIFRGPFKFFRMYVLRMGFLDGLAGLVLAALGCFSVFLKYAKLWELGRSREN